MSDHIPTPEPILVLLLAWHAPSTTPRLAHLLLLAPTPQAIADALSATMSNAFAPLDAGFPDIIGLSHTLALRRTAYSTSVPTPIYVPCPSDVHQLSPVLFTDLREPWVDTWTPQFPLHSLSSLSCYELEELLLFYLPHMPIDHHLAATRALLQRTPWSWGEAPTGGQL